MRMTRFHSYFLLFILLAVGMACGKKNVDLSRSVVAEARLAFNEGEWDRAISLLNDHFESKESVETEEELALLAALYSARGDSESTVHTLEKLEDLYSQSDWLPVYRAMFLLEKTLLVEKKRSDRLEERVASYEEDRLLVNEFQKENGELRKRISELHNQLELVSGHLELRRERISHLINELDGLESEKVHLETQLAKTRALLQLLKSIDLARLDRK